MPMRAMSLLKSFPLPIPANLSKTIQQPQTLLLKLLKRLQRNNRKSKPPTSLKHPRRPWSLVAPSNSTLVMTPVSLMKGKVRPRPPK